MKSTVLGILLALTLGTSRGAVADTRKTFALEFETLTLQDERTHPIATVFHAVSATDGALGGFVLAQVTDDYAQAYGGPSLTFAYPGLLITGGFGVGIEQSEAVDDRNPLRLAGFFLFDSKRHFLNVIAEIGATKKDFVEPYGYARYAWHAGAHFDIGAIARKGVGIGPRLDFWLHRPDLGVAFSPVYEPETEAWGGLLTFTTGY